MDSLGRLSLRFSPISETVTVKDLLSSTDMYYKVTLNDDNTFTINNCSNVMIQITSIKAVK